MIERFVSVIVLYILHFLTTEAGQGMLAEQAAQLAHELDKDEDNVLDVFQREEVFTPPTSDVTYPQTVTSTNAKRQAQARKAREAEAARKAARSP